MAAEPEPVAIVLAAGKSTRMKSDLPKVLHELCGQPLLAYVLAALDAAGAKRKLVVVGFGADEVRTKFAAWPGVEFVEQREQRGTGHAALACGDALEGHAGPIFVLAGDGPFVRPEMLRTMLERRRAAGAAALLATAVVADPTGMGRIVRDAAGQFLRIVEQKDATPAQAALREINPSFYLFDSAKLFAALRQVRTNNAQGEYYLTDAPGILREQGETAVVEPLADETDTFGINHRMHLAAAHALMQARVQEALMAAGVTIVDPRNTAIDARAEIGRDTVVHPFTVIQGPVRIGARCTVGPFAHLRPGTVLADGVEVGAFVQTSRATLGEGVCARHFAYLGDTTVGARANIGAGVITANFDGTAKHATVIGANVLVGSGSVLIAPVSIGDGATVGAGAVVTKHHDVRPGETVAGVPARPMKRG